MLFSAASLLCAVLGPSAVYATVHTQCFNYFLQKDGCVFSSADNRTRCTYPKPAADVSLFNEQPVKKPKLTRRYNTNNQTFFMHSGPGVCGDYVTEDEDGACLWAGNSSALPDAGWLNGAKTSNCRKQLYVQRNGDPSTAIYVPVLDACGFNMLTPETGCFEISLTLKSFKRLNPTPEEYASGHMKNLTWDFNNLNGNKTRNAPV